MELLFASQNKNKIKEIQAALQGQYLIKTLEDVGYKGELNEPHNTFEENAKAKARQGYDIFRLPCFAEDAGLVIDSLYGRPGVWSARYAGDAKDPQANMDKVLSELVGITHRSAYFVALIAFYDGISYQVFEGRINGTILPERQGTEGFGYDPIFCPDGFDESFAELGLEQKNKISHRAQAVELLIHYLLSKKAMA